MSQNSDRPNSNRTDDVNIPSPQFPSNRANVNLRMLFRGMGGPMRSGSARSATRRPSPYHRPTASDVSPRLSTTSQSSDSSEESSENVPLTNRVTITRMLSENPEQETIRFTFLLFSGDIFNGLESALLNMPNFFNFNCGPPPTKKEVVDSLPEIEMGEKELERDFKCSVCLEEFEKGMKVPFLPCHHHYHKDCIRTWLNMHNTCPQCRFEMDTDNVEYNSGVRRRNSERIPRPREEPSEPSPSRKRARRRASEPTERPSQRRRTTCGGNTSSDRVLRSSRRGE